ncbi:hypothetical protein [Jiangella muralis]|uniref:hypothetical protein n=1 Tax=Jiangella muralis TaxID=702383 RepID=UPI00069E5BE3|nr:hypothetical protein [Jiangella muralis]
MTKNSPDPDQVDREAQCLRYRREGKTYDDIAILVGYADRSGARKAVERALKRVIVENVDELRILEAQRLDELQQAIWDKALRFEPALGDDKALTGILRIMVRRAKLLGLDMPTKTEVTGAGGNPLIIEIMPGMIPDMGKSDDEAVELDP